MGHRFVSEIRSVRLARGPVEIEVVLSRVDDRFDWVLVRSRDANTGSHVWLSDLELKSALSRASLDE